ncbi:hypothetical protein AB0E74_06815 [Streptomyces sp. NPDC030392]|uniref:hypothetical protein n=1 Tax=Streptomyces sp. NPDC030392 TaxID=3155468 RepID=UPI0033E6314E
MSAIEETHRLFHWIMTVQHGRGQVTTLANTVRLPDGTTRAEAFDMAQDYVRRKVSAERFAVLFFSLEPNRL